MRHKKIAHIMSVGFLCLIFNFPVLSQLQSDYPFKAKSDLNGNIYITGEVLNSQNNTYDILIQKIEAGVTVINKTHSTPHGNDKGYDIEFDTEGNIYVVGSIYNNVTSSNDIIALKYNANGTYAWSFVVQSSLDDKGISLTRISEDYIAICGYISYQSNDKNFYTAVLSTNGVLQWEHEYGINSLTNDDIATHITHDDYYIYVGGYSYTNNTYKNDLMFLTYSHSGTLDEYLKLETEDNEKLTSFVISEYSQDAVIKSNRYSTSEVDKPGTSVKYIMSAYIKFNSITLTSEFDWVRIFGNSGVDIPTSAAVDSDHNLIVTGYSYNPPNNYDFVTLKYDKAGNDIWQNFYNVAYQSNNGIDKASSVKINNQNEIFVTGYSEFTQSQYVTIKYNPDGSQDNFEVWEKFYSPELGNLNLRNLNKYSYCALDSSGNPTILAFAYNDSLDIIAGRKYSQIGNIASTLPVKKYLRKSRKFTPVFSGNSITNSNNFPNPFNPVTNISFSLNEPGNVEVSIYDITGKRIANLYNGYLNSGQQSFRWNAFGYASGIYFYIIRNNSATITKKITLLK
ncbi:MAG TPA: T9SS type A sorting domain-containing protein [Ignavibacteria bacterium]|nr:T9SS type A sorting domain-containing protein [Ignavibacteria bacterium]